MSPDAIMLFLIGAVTGIVLYFKNKADKSEAVAVIAETKGADKILAQEQHKVEEKIDEVEKRDDSELTEQQRADRWGE